MNLQYNSEPLRFQAQGINPKYDNYENIERKGEIKWLFLSKPFTKRQNFRPLKIERICRWQIKGDPNGKICPG